MPERKWTKDEIISEIKRLHLSGDDIACNYCLHNRKELYGSARRFFGTWEKAVNAAGIDYGTIRKRRKPFSREKLLEWLNGIRAQGLSLDWTTVSSIDRDMADSIRGRFGSYRAAIEAVGLDYDKVNKQKLAGQVEWTDHKTIDSLQSYVAKQGNLGYIYRDDSKLYHAARRRYGSLEDAALAAGLDYRSLGLKEKWSEETVIRAIRDTVAKEGTLALLSKNNPTLASAASWYFGGVYKAAETAGLDANRLRIRKKWTKEMVIQELHEYVEKHGDLSLMQDRDVPLSLAVTGHFGSLEKALLAANLDYNTLLLNRRWTPEQVLNEIRTHVDKYGTLDFLGKLNPALIHAAIRRFGSLEKAVDAAGFDINSLRSRRNWTKDKIIKDVIQLHEIGEDLSLAHASQKFSSLLQAASDRFYFGSWSNAIEAAGLDYDMIRRNYLLDTFAGGVFEKYVRRAFRVLGFDVESHKRFRFEFETCVPDFYDPLGDTWIDAKLDSWGLGVKLTAEKYLRYKDRITIIYLRGKRRVWRDDSVALIPVTHYFKDLIELGAEDLVSDLKMLRQGILKPELQSQLLVFVTKTSPENKDEIIRLLDIGPDREVCERTLEENL